MIDGKYRKILNAMPEGVFAFDDNLRVLFTNAAFRRSFYAQAKEKGSLKDAVACNEEEKCGNNLNCAYCAFYKVMKKAVEQRSEQTETLRTSVERGGRTDKLSLRIRALPVDGKGKLFLGLTDGKYQAEMEREMLTAQQMQRRLLPAGRSAGGVSYAYLYLPFQGVGGDLPDVYEYEGQTYGVLSDVSGHGISAGMLSTFVKAGLDRKQKNLAEAFSALSEKFNELNQDERAYITVAGVRIDKKKNRLRYVVAGHNAPILLKSEEGIHEMESPAPPISNWVENYRYEEREMPFSDEDILVMVTDGVTECSNVQGELFGIERVESVLMQSRSSDDFISKLKSALSVFCGGKFTDDITAVAFDL